MKFIVTRKVDGAKVFEYEHEAAVEWAAYPSSDFDHAAQSDGPAPPPPTRYEGRRTLSKREFRLLLTQDERQRLDRFEHGFESAVMLESTRDAIRTYFRDYNLADEIRLDDPDVSAALDLMLAFGILLDPARKAEVLHG